VLETTTSISTRQSELRIEKKAMMMNTRTMTKRYWTRQSWPRFFENDDNEC
jgi:hypothetical protein